MSKKTLLEIVQDILSDTDGEDVNAIGETAESTQAAKVVETVYNNLVNNRTIPEHSQFFQLVALADSTRPTHFEFPVNMQEISSIKYDKSDDGTFEYREVTFMDPMDFIDKADRRTSDYVSVEDKNAAVKIRVGNTAFPSYWTTFDDKYVVMDSYKATVDNTLQSSKSRGYGVILPTFTISDSFTPDVDANYFPLLIQESKAMFMSLFHGGTDPKVEQSARRNRYNLANNLHANKRHTRNDYGR